MSRFSVLLLIVAFFLVVGTMPTYAGLAPHKHERHNSKERLKDGIYTPRDSNHLKDGEHHVEFDHEAIIGNVKEAQEYDSLSPKESKRRLTILLKLMDTNNDQHIDRHELKSWILRSFKKLGEEEALDRFAEIDHDNDNYISWKEYLQDVYAMEDENFKKEIIDFDSYEEEQNMIHDDKEMFVTADTNKDDLLDSMEFNLFHNPEEHPQMLPVVLEHTMRQKDKNHDGQINFQEFVGESGEHHDKEWLITEKERFDKDFDLNNDGVLTGNEVLNWVVPSNEDIAKDEVEHLFASTDEDHDDRLSFAEILENYETFVGSEATDYGDHLHNLKFIADEL